ncbi:MAG: uncharacterized protein KVP18_002471 [Porospora cf. gigantea A]|nr:MAG: hypothetical protein KVP18_002471 [Porospora cf. gigantea A]
MNVGMDELAARRHPYPSSHNSLSTLRGPESMKQGQQTLGLTSMLVGVQGRVSGNETVAILVWSKLFSQSLAVRHAEVAMKLRGTWPRLGVVQCGRFHRPDFRSGLPEALKKTYSDMKARLPTEPAVIPQADCDRTEGPWDVRATEQCLVGHDMGTLSPGHLESDSSWGLLGPVGLAKTRGAGGGAANRLHPADFFESLKDLTCADAGPLALIEHVEETPIVIPNLGMSVRIAQLYKPKGGMSDSQAEAKLRGRLGPFGSLHVLKEQDVPVGIPFLDSILKIKPNQGITMLVSPVNRVPLYYHPFKSTVFPSVSMAQATYKSGRFHDSRTTDFLLVRRNAENGGCKVYLRPLKATEKFGIAALYVAGQHHPVVRVPAPSSRKLVDYRREWLKSFVLRLAADGHSDLVYTRGVVHKVFGGLLEQALIQKILTSLKDSGTASVTANQWTTGGGQVRQVEERVIREIFPPETVCVIDSVSRGQWRLHQQGITQLSSHSKKVSRAVLDLDQEEKAGLAAQETHALKWAELVGRTRKQMLGMAVTEEDRLRVEQQVADWGRIGSSFFEDPTMGRQRVANRGSKLSTVARYVEEELLLTPWNISASIAEVCNTPSLRFAISGLGDPSGGRGEGLSLLRPGYMNKGDGDFSQTPLLREGEDLRKLNIKELTARLVKVGIDPLTLSRLGRWEQVALIRRCATEGAAALEGLQTDGAKMSMKDTKNQYLESVNRVFVKQRAALQADEPVMTSDDEAADEEAVVDQLEFDLLEGVTDEKIAPVTASQERADWEEYKDIYASSREERHERINQRAPLARLKWMRRRRNPLTGSFQGADEKIVYIYGESNIQKFLAWRERRVPAKRARASRPLRKLPTSATAAAMATLEASKATSRNCQSCGAPGHASSSSLCPKHPHNKANKAAKQAPRAPNTAFMKSSVLNAQFTPQAEHPVTAPAEWDDHVDSPTAVVGMLVTSDDAKAQIDRRGRRMKNPKKEEPASKMPARLTARQHRKLVESNVEGPKERFQGSVEGAVQELNQLLHRIVLNTKKSDRNFQLFWTEVDSRTAPNYYEIVKTPMYLALMVEKCKSRSYRSKHEFMADVNLIKGNCYLYNPEHHWIRPIVDRLEKFLGDQVNTSTVAYQINLVEEFLDDHKD